ncbi:hypothetical protein Tco_0740932 [Tanacetum coccineum]
MYSPVTGVSLKETGSTFLSSVQSLKLNLLNPFKQDDETNDFDDSDMDLFDDEPKRDDDDAGFGVLIYNKSTEPLKSTYLSPTVTCSSLDYIQSLLNETHVYELTNIMSHLVYSDAHTISVVHNLEGNPKIISYKSGASEVPFGTHVDVQATNLVLQDIFPDEATHHTSSPPARTTLLVPSCFVIFDLEPLSLSFDFFKHVHVVMNLTQLEWDCNTVVSTCILKLVITTDMDKYGFVDSKNLLHRVSAQSVGSSNTNVLDLPCLLVLITGTSQSRQHDMSESVSYYLTD